MASTDVHVKLCQQHVIKLDLEIKALIQDIQGCDGQLILEDLNQSVADKIKEFKIKLEELERFAKEQDRETNKVALLKEADQYRKQLASVQASLRKANFICQLTIERRYKEMLLDGSSETRQRKPASKQALANTATSVTENLMSLSRMMAAQVQQSEQTMGTLVSSSRVVGDTQEELKGMGGHIHSAHKIITKYGRRELTDKLLIFLALVFFFLSVLYVVKRRLFSPAEDNAVV